MPQRKGLLAPQNTFLDTIATRFDGTHSNFVLGNAQARDHPIVYCSDGFCELTAYPRAQVMSRNCSCTFLWGPDTTAEERNKIEQSLNSQLELKTEVVFYKKNGTSFICLLDIVPIKNEKGEVVLFLASHKDITKEKSLKADMESDDNEDGSESNENCNNSTEAPSPGEETGDDDDMDGPSTTYKYQRRRSRAVLYHLSGKFDTKPKTSKIQLNRLPNLSGKNTLPEYKVQEFKKSRFVLLHYSLFKIGWDWLILLCTFYIAIMVPYNAAYMENAGVKDLLVCDMIVELLFIIDIVLYFRTTYVSKSGQVVYVPRAIAVNYLKGWFLLDLLAAVPFDLIIAFQNKEAEETLDSVIGPRIHLMKLARLLRLARLLQKIDRYSQYSAVVLGLLMSMFALCAHWLACVWYVIGMKEMETNTTRSICWLYELSTDTNSPYSSNNTGGPTRTSSYISALYFTCSSLTSVGFGNVSPNTNNEKIFSICAMLIGALMHAAVFGNVTAIIQRMYARRAAYQTKTQDLKDFTRAHHIPKPLRQRMQEFFQTTWSMNRGIDTKEVLRDFPEELRGDIAMHLNREVLSLPIFEAASQGCVKSLAQQIKTAFCTPGEYLVHQGDMLKYIYFVCSGSLEILDADNSVVALLGKGDLFGTDVEPWDTCTIRSRYDVKSLTYCDLQCIDFHGLLTVLDQYPEYKKVFAEELQNELSYNMREGFENSWQENDYSTLPLTAAPGGTKVVMALSSISEDEEEDETEEEGGTGSPSLGSWGEESPFLQQDSPEPGFRTLDGLPIKQKRILRRGTSSPALSSHRCTPTKRRTSCPKLSTGMIGGGESDAWCHVEQTLQRLRDDVTSLKSTVTSLASELHAVATHFQTVSNTSPLIRSTVNETSSSSSVSLSPSSIKRQKSESDVESILVNRHHPTSPRRPPRLPGEVKVTFHLPPKDTPPKESSIAKEVLIKESSYPHKEISHLPFLNNTNANMSNKDTTSRESANGPQNIKSVINNSVDQ